MNFDYVLLGDRQTVNVNMLNGIIKIIRPLNCIITFAVIIFSGLICAGDRILSFNIFIAGVVGFISAAAGNIVNDIYDIEIDRINRPERPLPKLLLTIKQAWIFYIFLFAASLVISYLIIPHVAIFVLLSNILLLLYSLSLKRLPLIGNFVVSFLTGFAFIFGGLVVWNVRTAVIPALFAFLINFIRELIKDMEDKQGDKLANAKTFPILLGDKVSKHLVLAVSFVLFSFTFVPFVFQLYAIEFFLVMMVFVNPILFYSIKLLYQNSSKQNLTRISSLLKLNMVLGLIAIYLGT